MTKSLLIQGLNVCIANNRLKSQSVLIGDGVIQNIAPKIDVKAEETLVLPNNWSLLPGMIDMHIHGAAGADTMDATTQALAQISQALVAEGVTGFLATTITAPTDKINIALQNVATYCAKQELIGAKLLGVNLEGPFLSAAKAGAQNIHHMQLPNIAQFEAWQKIAHDLIKIATIAPEQPEAVTFIKYLVDHGVIAALGHSNATYEEAELAITVGANQATHMFNAMRAIKQRDPGLAMALLLNDAVKCEVIADLHHLHPAMLQLLLRVKGAANLILISDAMRAKALADGDYELGGQQVIVKDQVARLTDGTLAGSVVRLDQAVRNMLAVTDCSLIDIAKMTAENPAKQLKLWPNKGSIESGKDADLVVFDENQQVQLTIVAGEVLYRGPRVR